MNHESGRNNIDNHGFSILASTGVSLIELILVVAIISTIAIAVASFGGGFLSRNHLTNKTNEVVSSLRTAQLNTMSGKEDCQWGVETTSSRIKLYAVGDSSFDQVFAIPSGVSITSTNVVFDKLNGNSSAPTTIVVNNDVGESNSISINEVGIVDVN
jgi:Tfp pilus assembly protein FimT